MTSELRNKSGRYGNCHYVAENADHQAVIWVFLRWLSALRLAQSVRHSQGAEDLPLLPQPASLGGRSRTTLRKQNRRQSQR